MFTKSTVFKNSHNKLTQSLKYVAHSLNLDQKHFKEKALVCKQLVNQLKYCAWQKLLKL